MAHDRGALLLVDAYHGTGHVPTDVVAMDADFYTSGSLKWLLGGSGITFIYVNPRVRSMEPTQAGWWGMADMFDFNINSLKWRDEATRLEMGTPSMASVYAALGGLSYIEEIGVQRIRERDNALAADLIERAHEAGFTPRVMPNPDERTAIVLLNFDNPSQSWRRLPSRTSSWTAAPARCVSRPTSTTASKRTRPSSRRSRRCNRRSATVYLTAETQRAQRFAEIFRYLRSTFYTVIASKD